ncbi:cation transporter [Caldichromatium japonicum]|uniref:Cation transporter n=1 Tax=Caldichromatium japonicum TaxID=2699430 RepID=A0A6G7VDU1_9GAMM|nr:cation diffusion facilitator family transporter [Caldichromatium japonicum]QIK38018.1 cation transporter [Caldichromatium japonicum]
MHAQIHPPAGTQVSGNALILATLLTLCFAGIEALAGWLAGSLALVADAGHMLNDAAALGIAAGAAWLAQRGASKGYSYGLGRAELIAALINSTALLVLVAWLTLSAIERLRHPLPVVGLAVSLVAMLGLVLNVFIAWRLLGEHHNLNTRAALLHILGDLLGSAAALGSGFIILLTGWTAIDPLLSLAIGGLILISSLRLLREAMRGLMEGVPLHLDLDQVGAALARLPGVASVHDLHIWSVRSDLTALTAHLVVHDLADWDETLTQAHELLRREFSIQHATLQPEPITRRVRWQVRRSPIEETPRCH